jgi:hypothetical protein
MYVSTYVCMQVFAVRKGSIKVSASMYVYVSMYLCNSCMYVCMHACMHERVCCERGSIKHVYTYIYMCTCVFGMCIYIFIHQYMHAYINTHTHKERQETKIEMCCGGWRRHDLVCLRQAASVVKMAALGACGGL